MGFKPSYDWRNIYSAKDLVLNGTRWCIWNGESVNIVGKNWTPTVACFKSFTVCNSLEPDTKVSSLMDHDLGKWNMEILRDLFTTNEVDHISSIPISIRASEDERIWNYKRDGEYYVKLGYHLSRRLLHHPKVEYSIMQDGEVQKYLWKAPLLERTKNFIWRLLSNMLPTKYNMDKNVLNLIHPSPFVIVFLSLPTICFSIVNFQRESSSPTP